MGAEKCLDTITPEATISHGLCASLQPKCQSLDPRGKRTSEIDPDFGKRFASRCTEDAGRFREFLHCLLNSSSYSGPEEFSWWNPKKRNECVQDSSLEVGTQGERPSDGKSVSSMEGPRVTITSKQTSTSQVTMQTTGHNQWPPHPSKQLLLIEIYRNILDSF